MAELGKSIKMLRLEKGLTQRELAQQAGINHTTISHLEADRIKVSANLIETISKVICNHAIQRFQLREKAGVFDIKAVCKKAYNSSPAWWILQELPDLSDEQLESMITALGNFEDD